LPNSFSSSLTGIPEKNQMRTQHELIWALVLKPKHKPARAMARANSSTWQQHFLCLLRCFFGTHRPISLATAGDQRFLRARWMTWSNWVWGGGVCNKNVNIKTKCKKY
jgi:hypothetical protein